MNTPLETDRDLVVALLDASAKLERRLDGALSSIKGISFSEFQILDALAKAHDARATRVGLAEKVGLTPSGVTRALKPLEKLGFVQTTKDARDARRSIAVLTPQGAELVNDASGVVDDSVRGVDAFSQMSPERRNALAEALASLA